MGRPVRIDLEIGASLARSGASDRIKDTIDYGDLYAAVEAVASGVEHHLVEALGERIAARLLDEFEIDWVTVTVRKPKPIAATP